MSGIAGGLFYLRATSFRNAVVSRVMRLRQPKYLFGAVIGIAYFYFAFFRGFRRPPVGTAANMANAMPIDQVTAFVILGALSILVFFALCWMWSRERAALAFSEAEIAFLFPAPVPRKTLIHYRLLGSHFRLVLTALIFGLLSTRWDFLHGAW